ncbi:MAG: O-antigen ligase family protein [Anaerolineales bacterium]
MRPTGRRAEDKTQLDRVIRVLWVMLLVAVPFTSHPITAAVIGWSPVSPLSVLPLIALAVLWLPTYILRFRSLPKLSLPLLAFVVLVLISSLAATFLPIYPAFDQTLPKREFRSLLTLAAGVAFYLVAATWPRSERRLGFSLRWLYVGAVILMLYATFQIVTLPTAANPVPDSLIQLHSLFSIRDPLRSRITGFAYEPSWLGNQLVILYIPLWLGSVITGYSVYSRKFGPLSLEFVLLMWSLVVLFFSFGRLAWLSFFLLVAVLLILGSGRIWGRLAGMFGERRQRNEQGVRLLPRLATTAAGFVSLAVIVAGLVLAASILDKRIADSLSADLPGIFSGRHPWPYRLANELKSAERLMYWVSGLRVFSLYPILGVGLGNAGFLMASTMPAFGYQLPEIIRAVHLGAFGFPNPKSLWVRLLAETGVVGFALFVSWLVLIGVAAARIVRERVGMIRAIGLAALFALLAQVTEGFGMDTFGLPHLWLILGLLTAATQVPSGQR